MSNDHRKRPMEPRVEDEPHDAYMEPTRDDAGWRRTSPGRPSFTDTGDSEMESADPDLSYDPPKIEADIEVDVPVRVAYNQWTQFEDFPKFMNGVESVEQLDDKTLRWVADIGGKRKEWTAEIAEQQPDRCIAWHSTSGARNAGRVDFEPLGSGRCRLHLVLDYEPETTLESAADAVGLVKGRVKADLERFKSFIESEGEETGAWRGRIHGGHEET